MHLCTLFSVYMCVYLWKLENKNELQFWPMLLQIPSYTVHEFQYHKDFSIIAVYIKKRFTMYRADSWWKIVFMSSFDIPLSKIKITNIRKTTHLCVPKPISINLSKKCVATWTIILEWSAICEPGHFSYNWLAKVMVATATKYKFLSFDITFIFKKSGIKAMK